MARKIVIVDDEAYIRLLLEQTLEDLEEEGVEILTASNGKEGLALIQAERPQLVFLDVMMPLVNGFDVCRTVKHEWQMADIFIVLLTAKGQEYDKQRGDQVGANRYITKPFDPDAILELAETVLGL